MASLKRLLNPAEHTYGTEQRSPRLGFDDQGVPIDINPILPDQTWPNYIEELLGQSLPDDFNHGHGTAGYDNEVLDHAQDQIEQWAADNAPTQASSSLTPATPSTQPSVEKICFGMINNIAVKLRGNMSELDSKLSSAFGNSLEGFCDLGVTRTDDAFMVTFPDGFVMGQLSEKLEKALESVEVLNPEYEVRAPIRNVREVIGKANSNKEAIARVLINVYGRSDTAQSIGRELSNHRVYLQRPDFMRNDIIYDNPHVLKLAQFQQIVSDPCVVQVPQEEKKPELDKAEAFKKTIADVYSALKRGKDLVGLEGDQRLKTPLLLHQKKALEFMSERENGPIASHFLLWQPDQVEGKFCFRHKVTGAISMIPQVETGGGILADEMGMGKTLSILALILRTLEPAHEWSREEVIKEDSHMRSLKRTRATLIIASSDLMINEWNQEMERHFDHKTMQTLKKIKYHGQHREKDISKLQDADLIITTYHTLASDFATKKNPLNDFHWYRLVLDEAHIIRRQSTGLYRTVAQLRARSRWCLTGTPIQNRLEDIGSLFAFLKITPWHSMSNFRKFIAIPFDECEKRRKIATERFTTLLDSLCLRRTKELLDLPAQHDRVRHVEFSHEERAQYTQTRKMMDRAIRNQVGGFDAKSTLGHFQMQLQLRILCNHGTFQQPFSWNRRRLHLVEEREAMESMFGSEGEVTCSSCKQTMPMFGDGTLYRRYEAHCKHVLCLECLEESRPGGQESLPSHCPLCSSLWGIKNMPSQHAQYGSHSHSDVDKYFRPEGRSSKIEALMQDVGEQLSTTKSIIFSCWTRTLDLIQRSLKQVSITFERIDGDCPTSKREKIIEEFARNPKLRVLIMTTGTGAVGLNLAMANRVFIVEPQWNPSVENQAIARALRLGQEQAVQVTRYVVNKTVEQEMKTLQDRKLEIAEMAWE